MTSEDELVAYFEAARPRLLALAHRMLGSVHDAEDAVQTAWIRAQSAAPTELDNPDAWFTTVTSRLCLDQLRARERRGEAPLLAEAVTDEQLAADEELIRREDVSRALLVVLDQLTPAQRVAYVLHDLFRLPFGQIAAVVDTDETNVRKQASRARARIRTARAEGDASSTMSAHEQTLEAFLAAARGGDIQSLVRMLAPDAVRSADAALLPPAAPTTVTGAEQIAEETRNFVERIRASVPMLVNGEVRAVIAPGGHPFAIIDIDVAADRITRVSITPATPTDTFSLLDSATDTDR